jgi:hypothetical protein
LKAKILLDEVRIVNVGDTETIRNAIELIINRKYILYTSSLEEKNSWLKDLKSLKKEFQKKNLVTSPKLSRSQTFKE